MNGMLFPEGAEVVEVDRARLYDVKTLGPCAFVEQVFAFREILRSRECRDRRNVSCGQLGEEPAAPQRVLDDELPEFRVSRRHTPKLAACSLLVPPKMRCRSIVTCRFERNFSLIAAKPAFWCTETGVSRPSGVEAAPFERCAAHGQTSQKLCRYVGTRICRQRMGAQGEPYEEEQAFHGGECGALLDSHWPCTF